MTARSPVEEASRCRSHQGLAGRPEFTKRKKTFRGARSPGRAPRPVTLAGKSFQGIRSWGLGSSRGTRQREERGNCGSHHPMRNIDELSARPVGTASMSRRRVMAREGASSFKQRFPPRTAAPSAPPSVDCSNSPLFHLRLYSRTDVLNICML